MHDDPLGRKICRSYAILCELISWNSASLCDRSNEWKSLNVKARAHCPTLPASLSVVFSTDTNDRMGSTKPSVIAKARRITRRRPCWSVAGNWNTWVLIRRLLTVFHL